jgi:hypothetical protein
MSCSKHTNFSTNSPQDLNSNSRFKIKRRNKAGNKNRKRKKMDSLNLGRFLLCGPARYAA